MVGAGNFGQAPFTRPALGLYDELVLGATCHLVWRCPGKRILEWYRRHLTANHLEVGVGTGYFLDRSAFPAGKPRIVLLDLNANCLEKAARRIARHRPETVQANLLQPVEWRARRFDSVGLNYVLHCLPGALPEKGRVFAHLKALLNQGGTLFGATVLSGGVARSVSARAFMRLCNATGVFSNARDDLGALAEALRRHLTDVRIETAGCVALFSGRA